MCLYPTLIKNPKYKPNKKNGGNVPYCKNKNVMYVPIACGVCIECKQKKASEWRIRLNEELRSNQNKAYFVTLTYNEDTMKKYKEESVMVSDTIRHWLENIRKFKKKSIKHWLITEKGKLHRIHLHGIIWSNKEEIEIIKQKWEKYGFFDIGDYCNEKTINYIVKYVFKQDPHNKKFQSKIYCSNGIGSSYIEKNIAKKNKFNGINTNENYTLKSGIKLSLPIYYRNKIYTEEEREELWINKINEKKRYILGQKLSIKTQEERNILYEILLNAQEYNKKMGYNDLISWKIENYEKKHEKINK